MADEAPKDARSLSRQDFEKDVVLRARANPEFRQQLLADPKAAIHAAYGMEIPPDVEIRVRQETPSLFYLVLPVESDELTDEQLAAVAGGVGSVVAMKIDLFGARTDASALRMR